MTKSFSKSITSDSLTGMVFAAEGIKNAVTLLNGPMGCKFYHSTTSKFLSVRPLALIPLENGRKQPVDYNYLNSFFFRQERVPSTYLDGYDYVYGTGEKVRAALVYLNEKIAFDLLVIINSPGACLIGDHLSDLAKEILPDKKCVVLESPGFSEGFDFGYETAALEILKQLDLKESSPGLKSGKKTVNILGLSIWDRYNEGDLKELKRILALCGIEVGCALCSMCTLKEIEHIPDADLNLVINPRSGAACCAYLKEKFGMESLICHSLPVGFDSTQKLGIKLCEILGTDPESLIKESEKGRALCWYKINDIYQMCGKPEGVTFSISANPAQALGYYSFFTEYLGMKADSIEITGTLSAEQKALADALPAKGFFAAMEKEITKTSSELVFADANTIAQKALTGGEFCGIEISNPSMGYTDIILKTHLGINGAMFLTEQILNGIFKL